MATWINSTQTIRRVIPKGYPSALYLPVMVYRLRLALIRSGLDFDFSVEKIQSGGAPNEYEFSVNPSTAPDGIDVSIDLFRGILARVIETERNAWVDETIALNYPPRIYTTWMASEDEWVPPREQDLFTLEDLYAIHLKFDDAALRAIAQAGEDQVVSWPPELEGSPFARFIRRMPQNIATASEPQPGPGQVYIRQSACASGRIFDAAELLEATMTIKLAGRAEEIAEVMEAQQGQVDRVSIAYPHLGARYTTQLRPVQS